MIEDLRRKIAEAEKLLGSLEHEKYLTQAQLNDVGADGETAPIIEKIENAEAINRKIRENISYLDAQKAVRDREAKSTELSAELDQVDAAKLKKIQSAKFPIEGLSITDSGVTFNGVPFEQASGAEQLRVSVAIGMAANPKLRVLLCRDGSLLDETSLRILTEIVQERDYQLWLERVGEGKECTVIIEDGYVKDSE